MRLICLATAFRRRPLPGSVHLVSFIECASPRRLADFWLAALGWAEAYAHGDEIGIEATDDADDRIPATVFWRTDNPRHGKNRLQMDLRARDLTASADAGQPPDARWAMLADPENNVFCVLPPD